MYYDPLEVQPVSCLFSIVEDGMPPANGITVISSVLTNNNTLQELILSRNNFTIEGARNIADAVQKNTTLQRLDISYCNIHSKGALNISESTKSNKTLRELIMSWKKDQVTVNTADQFWDLHNKKIENIGMLTVSQLLHDSMKVLKLNTSFNEITDDGVVAICNFLSRNNALQELDISHNQITIKRASNIAQVLQVNTTLLRLDISYCNIPNEGMIVISDRLKSNNVLQEFYCRYNNITVEGANTIAKLIQLSTRSKAIDISCCGITVKGAVIISKSCKHSKILQKAILSWIDIENITAKQKEGYTVNTSVQDCELTGQNIGNSGALIISNLLFNIITTKNLDISLNNISDISAI
ncbi:leucine-rich repeat-containing protein 74A-like [Dysidea avara]|uniref:leucine-rich repeat-containing protein 74A-like n=1 Tax=Dysidea avara TaxID=196820 RepID=UPI00331828D9